MRNEILLSILMVASAVILTWKWLSLYDKVDSVIILSAFVLTLSLSLLIISVEYRMQKMKEEFESVKRAIALNSADLEERIEGKLRAYIEPIEKHLERIDRKLYR
uniref:Uncharacterized protein n=1 Tax=Geoglobus ahangari TaxID=113653 RepID=A0A7C4WCY5_9EURY